MGKHSQTRRAGRARVLVTSGATLAFVLCGGLAAQGIVAANAEQAAAQDPTQITQPSSGEGAASADSAVSYKTAKRATKKTETVRVSTNAYGDVRSVKVDATLKNGKGADTLRDRSTLADIEVEGERAYTADGARVVWDAQGEDVSYSGTSRKELPVSVTVYYKLDGTSVTADELAGASGHVSIRYVYENHLKSVQTIEGENAQISTPFMAATALVLDNDVFSNVKVEGGRLIEDGTSTIAAGMVLPGLKESLDLDDDIDLGVDLSNSFEVEADVKDFKLASSVTYVTPSLLDGSDTESFGMSGMDDAFGTLSAGAEQLAGGGDALAGGLDKLEDGAEKLGTGLANAKTGSSQLASGLASIEEQSGGLGTGAAQLKSGLESLSTGVAGAQSALEGIASGTGSADNPGIAGVANQLEALAETTEDEDQKAKLTAAASALQSYASGVLAIANGGSVNGEQTAGLAGIVAALGSTEEAESLIGGAAALKGGADALATALGQTSEAAGELTGGMGQLAKGAKALKKGTAASQEGAAKLAQGIRAFNTQGIQKLIDTVNSGVNGAKGRFDALVEAGERYQTFSGKAKKTKGSVTFIYQVDGIEKAKE